MWVLVLIGFFVSWRGLGVLFGSFLESFWILLGALGPSLGDFLRTLAASGVAFETFVGFWACLVALGRIWKVFEAFLKRFSTFLDKFNVFSMIFLFFLLIETRFPFPC